MTEFEIAKLQLRRGDLLVVRAQGERPISHEARVKIGETVRQALERAGCDFVPVLVVDQNYTLEVVQSSLDVHVPPQARG